MFRQARVIIIALFISLNMGALLYITSTFLANWFSAGIVSLLFIIGAAANIALFLIAPHLLNWFGKRLLLVSSLLATSLGTFALALATTGEVAAFGFVLYASFLLLNYYCLDIFLEELSSNSETGEIRGIYFTFVNAGIAAGPLLLALLTATSSLSVIYWSALFLLIPAILIALFYFPLHKDIHKRHMPHSLPFKKWWYNKDVRSVTLAKIALETFYGFMVIYTPIYLHGTLGFPWAELGLIFTVALLPFVLFEWPIGELADRYLGEKEIMSLGFFITGSALLVMPFIGKIFLAWMAILFLSRVGASFVEITTESYFFEKIDHTETGLLSIFRLTRPASIILTGIMGIVFLNLFSIEKIFFLIAFIALLGFRESLYITDTR